MRERRLDLLPVATGVGLAAWSVADRRGSWLVCLLLALLALWAWRFAGTRALLRGLWLAGGLLLLAAMAWGLALRPELATLQSLSTGELIRRSSGGLVLAGMQALAKGTDWVPVVVLGLAGAIGSATRNRTARAGWFIALAATAQWGWLLHAGKPPAPAAHALLQAIAGPARVAIVPDVPFPDPQHVKPTWSKVGLVVVESAGWSEVERDLASRQASAFARLVKQARLYTDVVAAANSSHLGQPALLHGHDFSPGPEWAPPVTAFARPAWSFPAYFGALGFRTSMVSSQDESWLEMKRLTLDLHWTAATHAPDNAEARDHYADLGGVSKVWDQVTVQQARAMLAREAGPLFLYVVLQNTHFPYVTRGQPVGEGFGPNDFMVMPAERVELARQRYRTVLAATLDEAANLALAHPEMLWIIVGDHGESMQSGFEFAHAKHARTEEAGTFAAFFGPGITAGVDAGLRSTVDVLPMVVELVTPGQLPAGAGAPLDGSPLLDSSAPVTFIYSSGLRAPEVAAVDEVAELSMGPGVKTCRLRGSATPAPAERCRALEQALRRWARCKTASGRGVAAQPDACFHAARAAGEPK